MYFKEFPRFLYDFNYGNKEKTSIVLDITRNIRVKREILQNVVLYDEYDIVDGETPEIISEKFYGTPEYHWIIMIANGKYDYRADFPLPEPVLQEHIKDVYNPTLMSSDWYWRKEAGETYFYIKISNRNIPFDNDYLTAPIVFTITDDDKSFSESFNFGGGDNNSSLDDDTQYFRFKIDNITEQWLLAHGTEGSTAAAGVGAVELTIDTVGREHNPVFYTNMLGNKVDPSPSAIPVTGDTIHRQENDSKRRIKIISPSLLESIIRNYEEEML